MKMKKVKKVIAAFFWVGVLAILVSGIGNPNMIQTYGWMGLVKAYGFVTGVLIFCWVCSIMGHWLNEIDPSNKDDSP